MPKTALYKIVGVIVVAAIVVAGLSWYSTRPSSKLSDGGSLPAATGKLDDTVSSLNLEAAGDDKLSQGEDSDAQSAKADSDAAANIGGAFDEQNDF